MLKKQKANPNVQRKLQIASLIIKYLFAVGVTVLAAYSTHHKGYLVIGMLELLAIAFFSNSILNRHLRTGRILNGLLTAIYCAQMLILFFSNEFLSWMMITNLANVNALSGKGAVYILAIVAVIVICCLPVGPVSLPFGLGHRGLPLVLAMELALTVLEGSAYSPYCSLLVLGRTAVQNYRQRKYVESLEISPDELYKDGREATAFDQNQNKPELPASFPENPNIIVIYTEGMSQNIVEDERNIMPTVRKLEGESVNFTGYFNHTFATYKGIQGQECSGYQVEDTDLNHLISLKGIFDDRGYTTELMNPEPYNKTFTKFLGELGFDRMVNGPDDPVTKGTYTDKEMYGMLKEEAQDLHQDGKPFYLAMYTYNTHVGQKSEDKTFGDGSDDVLNRFYNLDCCLDDFLQWFEKSGLYDNTLLVFTTDHASYADNDFTAAFPDHERIFASCDRIPLCFYYKGVKAASYDVNGRNSLDFAPTLLDFLNVEHENYFLGSSLFGDAQNDIEYTFFDGASRVTTFDGQIKLLMQGELPYLQQTIDNYIALSQEGAQ